MADKLEDAEFWLPSEFLTDEDVLMDNKENFNKYGLVGLNSSVQCFLSHFPYDYASSLLSSPVESSLGSVETESDEEDSLLAELTRQLAISEATHKVAAAGHSQEKAWVLSSSPQSTLTQVGSWSGRSTGSSSGSPNGPSQVSSPPTTPQSSKNDAWDLIYQAAGQVARLKRYGGDGSTRTPGLSGPQKWHVTPKPSKTSASSPFHHGRWQQVRGDEMLKQVGCGMWNRDVEGRWSYEQELSQHKIGRVGVGTGGWDANGRGFDAPSCAWPTLQVQQRNQLQPGDLGFREGLYLGNGCGYGYGFGSAGGGNGGCGGGLKRERTGTGVFLPRRYGNINNPTVTSDSRKKPVSSPANLHPARVMPDLNKMASSVSQPQAHQLHRTRANLASVADYETLVAQRNALLLTQQRRSLGAEASMSHEICLPQEWTY